MNIMAPARFARRADSLGRRHGQHLKRMEPDHEHHAGELWRHESRLEPPHGHPRPGPRSAWRASSGSRPVRSGRRPGSATCSRRLRRGETAEVARSPRRPERTPVSRTGRMDDRERHPLGVEPGGQLPERNDDQRRWRLCESAQAPQRACGSIIFKRALRCPG